MFTFCWKGLGFIPFHAQDLHLVPNKRKPDSIMMKKKNKTSIDKKGKEKFKLDISPIVSLQHKRNSLNNDLYYVFICLCLK